MANAEGRKRNPYIIGFPIDKPKLFFGRESLFHFIEDNLQRNVKVILLHGQRSIDYSPIFCSKGVLAKNLVKARNLRARKGNLS